MKPTESLPGGLRDAGRLVRAWLAGWWHVVRFGAEMLVLAMSPSSYGAAARGPLQRRLVQATAPNLLWFIVLASLLSLVLIRIVVVTARSYGLSQYAVEMVVRVLVLELIPLTAALFVAVRYAIPGGTQLYKLRAEGAFHALRLRGLDPLRHEVLPRALAGIFSVLLLAGMSCAISLVLAYLTVYGFSPWGFAAYTRIVGQVFNPAVTLIFTLKTLLFSLAVALMPLATALQDVAHPASRPSIEMRALIRMFAVLLLVEVLSLVGNYY